MHEAAVGAIQVQTHVNLPFAADIKLVRFRGEKNPSRRLGIGGWRE